MEEEEEELNHWDVVSHMLWSAEVEEDSEADRHSSWDMDGVGDSSGPEDSQGPTVVLSWSPCPDRVPQVQCSGVSGGSGLFPGPHTTGLCHLHLPADGEGGRGGGTALLACHWPLPHVPPPIGSLNGLSVQGKGAKMPPLLPTDK